MKLNNLLDYVNSGKNLPKAKPPSEILLEAHKKWEGTPDNSALLAIAKEALLLPEEVRLWLKHLEDVACNRKRGGGGQRKQQPNGEQICDRELACQMFAIHATVKSHHLQKTTMTKMLSK